MDNLNVLIDKTVEEKQTLNKNNEVITKKEIDLTGHLVDENGNIIMNMRTALQGDGATPSIISYGDSNTIAGYNDDGTVRVRSLSPEIEQEAERQFRARAIKEQKELSEENGIDPKVVNEFGAENNNKKG